MINFHKRIGMQPGFCIEHNDYGSHWIVVFRFWWSAITLTVKKPVKKKEKK